MTVLNLYLWALDINREKRLVWDKKGLKVVKISYGILRFGGLYYNIAAREDRVNHSMYDLILRQCDVCAEVPQGLATVLTCQLVVLPIIYIVMSAHVANISLSYMSILPINPQVIQTSEEGYICSFHVSQFQVWCNVTAPIALIVYETILFGMLVLCFIKHYREVRRDINRSKNMTASSNDLTEAISSYIYSPDFVINLAFSDVIPNICYTFYVSMLGPLMMLSIREYHAAQVSGGESSGGEELVETLEFAVLSSQYKHANV
ncbi:hypothetical protein CONPUDRAFT_75307 [Coniophora puteana RWD-64-598 SS2]|uniref:Uncharacterized protein n=1 Tax=Coniophora puteana (strain RWD-64-598) TaxID=741705 RepID=A0A5M3MJA6_CONPW|nr:uncharacterized protein CONPUDRAFT_75307 [Coniophora puteana RWD-64-598 SS2]EIW78691.1 hypothetical protein CONPUDRAFT_75307 [Coniophora puteana RWD-64-598 SS2]